VNCGFRFYRAAKGFVHNAVGPAARSYPILVVRPRIFACTG
jgi:hypothetical protein